MLEQVLAGLLAGARDRNLNLLVHLGQHLASEGYAGQGLSWLFSGLKALTRVVSEEGWLGCLASEVLQLVYAKTYGVDFRNVLD